MNDAGVLAALLVALAVLTVPGRRGTPRPRPDGAPSSTARASRRRPGAPDRAALTELFAAAVESGATPAEATRWCARHAGAAVPALEDADHPADWWDGPVPAVARALRIADRLGSPVAPAVRAAADAERDIARAESDLASGLAGVRVTAWLLTALPVCGAVLAATTAPVSVVGAASTVLGGLLTAAGWWGLRLLTARARREALS